MSDRFTELKVLLVEDEGVLRKMLVRSLTSLGFAEVVAAESADAARVLVEDGFAPDLLFSDIRMPGEMNGLEFAHWLRGRSPSLPVVLQTGFTEEDTSDFTVLRKPFDRARLAQTLADALPGA